MYWLRLFLAVVGIALLAEADERAALLLVVLIGMGMMLTHHKRWTGLIKRIGGVSK